MVYFGIIASRLYRYGLAGIVSAQEIQDGSPVDATGVRCPVFVCRDSTDRRGARVQQLLRHSWPVLIFFSYCLISLMWSDFPLLAFKRWTKCIGESRMMFLLLFRTPGQSRL